MKLPIALLACFLTLTNSLAAQAADVEPDVLQKIEAELSIPTCGLGLLETRMAQLKAFEGVDHLAALEAIAREDFTKEEDNARAYLPQLSARLMTQFPEAEATRALRALLDERSLPDASRLRLVIAQQLAGAFGDAYGLAILSEALRNGDTQTTADTFTALVRIDSEAVDTLLAPVAFVPDGYVIGRVFWDVKELSAERRQRLLKAIEVVDPGTVSGGYAGMGDVTLLLLGAKDHEEAAVAYLRSYEEPLSSQALYNLSQIAQLLLANGHLAGAEAAIRAVGFFQNLEDRGWYEFALSVFVNALPYERTYERVTPEREATAMADWLEKHRATLVFEDEKWHE